MNKTFDNFEFHLGPESFDDPDETEWIEAPFLFKHNSIYYLFVNWFGCCNGIDSTYEIHVGRSDIRTGKDIYNLQCLPLVF